MRRDTTNDVIHLAVEMQIDALYVIPLYRTSTRSQFNPNCY